MATQYNRQLANMRGQVIRNVGKPKEANDAMTFAVPSFTTTQISALVPATGMLVFNSSTLKLNFYDGSTWRVITST